MNFLGRFWRGICDFFRHTRCPRCGNLILLGDSVVLHDVNGGDFLYGMELLVIDGEVICCSSKICRGEQPIAGHWMGNKGIVKE